MIRDEELNRLIRYAQGMGLSVRFKPYVNGSKDEAQWTVDGTEITVFVRPRTSKLDKVLSLIHELGHHKAFVARGREIDPELDEALGQEENSKRQRKAILIDEREGVENWDQIYHDTNCKFGVDRLNKQKELDVWSYEVYYESGKFPTRAMKYKKRKQVFGR